MTEPPPPAPTKRVICFKKSEYQRLKELAEGKIPDDDGPEVEDPVRRMAEAEESRVLSANLDRKGRERVLALFLRFGYCG